MFRIEVIMDQTIEDILLEKLAALLPGQSYTLLGRAHGLGESGPRRGTAVWPEENSLFLFYMEEENLTILKEILGEIRRAHPQNGLAAFSVHQAEEMLY